ncbi:MAG: helix-turn-helix domain-containing protein [Lewinellaceae bacterium]|nr:helix-turn-helix domain-containing protein [Lewinellaceae bacterium]
MLRPLPLWLFLALALLGGASCQRSGESIPEPNYAPHILQPGPYTPAQGRKVDRDSVKKPEYSTFPGVYLPGTPPRFTPFRSLYHRTGKPRYLPGNGQAVDMASFAPPQYIPAKAKRVPSSWPEWRPAQPDYSKDTRYHFTYLDSEHGMSADMTTCLIEARDGKIWAGTWGGGISVWDGAGFMHFTETTGLSHSMVGCLMQARDGRIWIGTWGAGISVWDGNGFTLYGQAEGLSSDVIRTMTEGRDGRIWIGTNADGANVWDGKGFVHYTEAEGLNNNGINSSLVDSGGNVWLGTWGGGINIWSAEGFTHYSRQEGLVSNDIRSILEDHQGRLWVGTNGAGISILDDHTIAQLSVSGDLNSNIVTALLESRDGRFWIGTWGEGINIWDGSGFIQYKEGKGLSSNTIACLIEARDGKVWAGTWGEGINVWDGAGFTYYSTAQGLANNIITTLLEAGDGKVWAGTANGVSVWDGQTFTNFTEKEGLQGGFVWSLLEDEQGHIWIGTNDGGINVWDGAGFTHYTTDEGLRDNNISSLCQDRKGNIWVGTHKGLHRLSPQDEDGSRTFRTFLNIDGLGGISIGKMLVDQKERLWLYTSREVNRIDLNSLTPDTSRPVLAMRELQSFFDFNDWRKVEKTIHNGEDIRAGEQQVSLKGIRFDSIQRFTNLPIKPVFPYNINQLTLSWQAIQWQAPHQLQYSYLLEGQDRFWSPLAKETKITFQDLQPGRYTFKVRAVGGNNQWSDTAEYTFTIRQPWWWTNLAKLIYLFLGIAVVLGAYRYQLSKKLAEQEARQLKELDDLKSRFFTNISHEFRTPLTVISGMITQMEQQPDRWRQKGIELIKRNSHQLLSLINQILDLRKLESGALEPNLIQADIIPFLQYLANSFVPMAQSKGIRIHFLPNCSSLEMDYDPDKVLHILSNLLSNAIKYTPGPGDIYFQVDCRLDAGREMLAIQLRDNGKGISPEALPYIFDRFYQVEDLSSQKPQGSGIGLALTKELVKLLDGTIEVDSKLGAGTTFSLLFPVRREAKYQDEGFEPYFAKKQELDVPDGVASAIMTVESGTEQMTGLPALSPADDEPAGADARPTLLIVEDNPDVRLYLTSCLERQYQLIYAENGQEGIDRAFEKVPDIILSDVMMPVMDGFALCDTLKKDERTSHIPIVMLTAKADFESRMQGLRKRADAYLAKPFEEEELLVILDNLLEARKQLQAKYAGGLSFATDSGAETAPAVISDAEEAFLKKLKQVVLQHIEDAGLSGEFICREMNMSRTNLYRKLKALTDLSISHFVRQVRLEQAKELLLHTDKTISEVAYEVGFTDPKYFSRIFSETFQQSPSQFRGQ